MAYVTAPVTESACSIPTDADDDCITAVSTAPTIIPSTGFVNSVKRFVNCGTSVSGFTAPDICSIPNISTAKPRRIVPIFFFLSVLLVMKRIIPITASIGVKDEGLSIFIKKLSPLIPERLSIHDVTVVPTFAPIIMPTACLSCIIPAFTKPTTITVVADDDCIIAVTPRPSTKPFSGFDASFSSKLCNLFPACLSSPFPIMSIPKRNIASPPKRESTPKISIF